MKILIFDNYDSFTYNLVHLVKELGYTDVEVHRNDALPLSEVERFDKIILSPGPGIPSEAGQLLPLIRTYMRHKSILGVCLGEQAIGEVYGATLHNLDQVYHGVCTQAHIVANDYIFDGLGKEIEIGRYHSWIVGKENFPQDLVITAVDEQKQVMALRHQEYDVHGVQFHPESILTPCGATIINNFLRR